jgi:hypothetical protein
MSRQNEERRPPADQAGEAAAEQAQQVDQTEASVTRAQRPWRPAGVRVSATLDALCSADQVTTIDYHACGLDLGYAERRALGVALLVLDRAEQAA